MPRRRWNRTNDAAELRELIEAKFVDGLRSVAATMNLEELQEQRAVFVKSVQDAVGADIQNNGLELESVSLTRLDQSDIKHFNPNNFFDAQGLTTLTKIPRSANRSATRSCAPPRSMSRSRIRSPGRPR